MNRYTTKPAIEFCDGSSISFVKMDRLSNKVAAFLLARNTAQQAVVIIQNNKTAYGYAAMLACLKIGAIYVNVDAINPKERLDKIFDTAQPLMILADAELNINIKGICDSRQIPYFNIQQASEDCAECPVNVSVEGDAPAYIMFTSGSTGVPKGVVIKHSSIINFVKWAKTAYELQDDDKLTGVNPIYFDNSVFDFYVSIFNGLTLVAFPLEITSQPKKLLELIDKSGCTFWFSVPSFLIYLTNLRLLTKDSLKTIRAFSFGGEGYPKELLKKLYDLYRDQARFYNVYGPTEGTCICSAYKIKDADFDDSRGLITLGRIADIFGYQIIDGELCLSGPQLALGYYNDPIRTANVFIKSPINGERIYKTGDIVEEHNGLLYFMGRKDNQIKHMGYRIELEEIETALVRLPYVKQCAVIQQKSDKGISKLIAFIACDEEKEQKELRANVRDFLPEYMVPTIFVIMPELPKNPNGKVDRVRLGLIPL